MIEVSKGRGRGKKKLTKKRKQLGQTCNYSKETKPKKKRKTKSEEECNHLRTIALLCLLFVFFSLVFLLDFYVIIVDALRPWSPTTFPVTSKTCLFVLATQKEMETDDTQRTFLVAPLHTLTK